MKKYITTTFTKLAVLVFVLCTSLVKAQTDLPEEPDDIAAPIDDYVWLLAIIAVTYAVIKMRAIFKKGLQTAK